MLVNTLVRMNGDVQKFIVNFHCVEIYSDYPSDSLFKIPDALKSADVKWVRLRLTGRRRVIGFMLNYSTPDMKASEKGKNIFYIVFLDKKHEFAPSRKNDK